MRVKVCGITKASQALQASEAGADFAGFIFYPPSSRYVFKHMPANEIKKLRSVNKVGVFVNANVDDVLRTVDECGLYLVQLHGDESPRYCEKISQYITVIKAFRISGNENISWKIKDYHDAADMFMFDTDGAGFGGTGKKFDWQMLKETNIGKPFFLSGGIAPEDAEIIRHFEQQEAAKDLFALDINSRFEVSAGVKDMEKVKAFINEVKR
jgi:phosphoribosylanthranilate isomerase